MGEPLASPTRVGIIGCGTIVGQYLSTFQRLAATQLVAVADLDPGRAAEVASRHEGVRAVSPQELLAADDVDLVVNLTVPAAHAEVALEAIAAGKSVYNEKPLAVRERQAREVLEAAAAAGVVVGCAPDTVLGTGIQTARRAIDDGLIGQPIAATATMAVPGHERWHPNPDFYYQPGGGPVLDMGPYYLTALVTLLGPVASVFGCFNRLRDSRTIGSGPRAGQQIPVKAYTHVTGVVSHANGVLSTVVMSFDVAATRASHLEVHGTAGSLVIGDPNHFSTEVLWHPLGGDDWQTLPVTAGYRGASRGYGVADFIATTPGEEPRTSSRLALHVLEAMERLLASAAGFQKEWMMTKIARPAPVPLQSLPER